MQISNFLFIISSLILFGLNSDNYQEREKYKNIVSNNMYLYRHIKPNSAESLKSLRNLEYFECKEHPLNFFNRLMTEKLVLSDKEAILIIQQNSNVYRSLAAINSNSNTSYSYSPFVLNDLTTLNMARKAYVENPKRVQTIWKLQSIRFYK